MSAPSVDSVLEHLRAASIPERRERTAGYFPTAMEILGVPVPEMRRVLRPLARALRQAPQEEVLGVARDLLGLHVHETRQIAFELIGGRADIVCSLSSQALEALGSGNDNWASVDCFAVFLSGPAWRDGRIADRDVVRWTRSDDRWWRRTALVSTVPLNLRSRGGGGDVPRTLSICTRLVTDGDLMVAKALSWALRSLAMR